MIGPEVLPGFVELGQASVTLPLAGLVFLHFWSAAGGARALRWLVTFAAGCSLVGIGKQAFEIHGWSLPALSLYNVSGHAMLTAAVYPILLMLLAVQCGGRRHAAAGAVAGFMLAAVMLVALVVNSDHTLAETVAGLAVGLGVAVANLRPAPPPSTSLRLGTVAVCVGIACLTAGVVAYARWELWERAESVFGIEQRFDRFICTDPATARRSVTVVRVRPDDGRAREGGAGTLKDPLQVSSRLSYEERWEVVCGA